MLHSVLETSPPPLSTHPSLRSHPGLISTQPVPSFHQGGRCGHWWQKSPSLCPAAGASSRGETRSRCAFLRAGTSLPSALWWENRGGKALAVLGGEGAPCQPQRTLWLRACRHMRAPALCCGCQQLWRTFLSTQLHCWGVGLGSGSRGQVHTELWRLSFGQNC